MRQALILENIDRSSTYSFLRTNDFTIKKKLLHTSISNWESICDILEDDSKEETIIVAKFTEAVLERFLLESYQKVSKKLIDKLLKRKHIVFIYSDNYHGYFNFRDGYATPDEVKNQKIEFSDELKSIIQEFKSKQLNIVTYETLTDLELASQSFIENIAQGLLFKFYIPNNKYGSLELDKFIILFKEFISTISDKAVRIHQNRTSQGVTYSLYSENAEIRHEEVYSMFDDFAKFMELCLYDPKKAAEILEDQNVPKAKISLLITRYVKEAKRILLDLKQDKERRLLLARQSLESDLLEDQISSSQLDQILNDLAPASIKITDIIGETKVGTINLNFNSQIINKVEGAVAKEFHGDFNFSREDEQLKLIIEKYAQSPAQRAELGSAISEMNDLEIPTKDKKFAASKLKSFVIKYSEKIGDIGFSLLTKYLENKMGLE